MQELFNILNLPENSSKEDVRSVFMAWKKKQQQILSHGKPEEQKSATENITKVTALYKQFMNNSAQSNDAPKISEKPKSTPNPVQVTTEITKVSSQIEVSPPKKQDKKINVDTTTPISVKSADEINSTIENKSSKNVVTVLIVLVVILCGSLLYLLNDKKNVAMDTANDFIKTPLKLTEDSSIHSGRVIASANNKTSDNPRPTETVKPVQIQGETNKLSKPSEIPDKNVGKTASQRAAVQTILDFHDNITKRNFGKAYDCLSWDFQSYMSYDGWVPGFATTVSSEVSDIKIVSETSNTIVLTYILKAVDNINGRQEIAYFNGTVTIINENGSWKIDEIKNKVR